MDRRSWPWKKKSYDGTRADAPMDLHFSATNEQQEEEQPSRQQSYEDRARHLSGKLSTAIAEVKSKDDLVKQHAKVAEEAVSGWEKAEKEALLFKEQLDAALVQKSGLEDRVTHLDAALKECMRELRHVREEQEQTIRKANEWDKVRVQLEANLAAANDKVAESEAQQSALSKALQERGHTICELTEAKARAEADAKVMQIQKEEAEKKSLTLKYEVQVLSKEVEIRNEEKDCNQKMADALGKQQLDNVKKMARMEAECQRLRGLVRKRLPGPAALAQMKLELDGSPRGNKSSSLLAQEEAESKEAAEKLLGMEEETKMLKEALAKRSQELHTARLMCAKTASKLSLVEEQLDQLTRVNKVANGGDADSWASALVVELEQFKKGKDESSTNKLFDSPSFDLMDDFIEMERLTTTSRSSDTAASECGVPIHDETIRLDEMLLRKERECCEVRKTCDELRKKLSSSEEKIKELEHRKLSHSALEMRAKITDMDKIIADARDRFGLKKTREQDMTATLEKVIRLVKELAREVDIIDLDKLVLAKQHFLQDQGAVQELFSELSAALERLLPSVTQRLNGENAEFNTCAVLEEDITNLKNEKSNVELQLGLASDKVERLKVQLSDSEQLVSNLRVQLSSTEESKKLAENDLAVLATLKAELEAKVRAAGVEIGLLQENAEVCKCQLEEERARYQGLLRSREKQNSFAMPNTCEENSDKEREIAAAAERLADCQRTIMVLGKQLQSLSRPSKSSRDLSEVPSDRLEQHRGTLQSESEEEEWQMHRSSSDINRIRNARENVRKQEVYWSSATSTDSYTGSADSSPVENKSSKGLTRFFLRGK